MPKRSKTVIQLTVQEYEHKLTDAAKAGAEEAIKGLQQNIDDLQLQCRVEIGLVTTQDVAELYGVTAQTVRNWGLEPVNSNRRPYLYRVEDIPEQVEANSE